MKQSKCPNCPLRAKYDANPQSFIGRLWRWHINFCPGWRGYFNSLSPAEQEQLRSKYQLKK